MGKVRGTEMPDREKKVIIIAGPNGAGKSTFAREFLPNEAGCLVFINADLIAAGLSPFQPELMAIKAGRLMLEEMERYARLGESFAIETTLSGLGYVKLIREWRKAGYDVKLMFLGLSSPEQAIERVQERVRQGGHDIPEMVIRRRFWQGLKRFQETYKTEVNRWWWYDNSGNRPVLLEEGEGK
jgi:predicted ABC-type ATPase